MLIARRKELSRSITIRSVMAVILLIVNLITGAKVLTRAEERAIGKAVISVYPNLTYDRRLSRIAEGYAKTCYTKGMKINTEQILEDREFVKLYSTDTGIAEYTIRANSNRKFIVDFRVAMQDESYLGTHACLRKCQYVGIGKYKNQIFLLAFYPDK